MDTFIFNEYDISQHVVKYGVDVRPPLTGDDREKLQVYCNWLVDQYPQAFETLLSGHDRTIVQKTFVAGNGKRIELPTFAITNRGFCCTFPVRLFVESIEDFDIPQKAQIFRQTLEKFRQMFGGRKMVRVGVINEIIFDCGSINSVQVIASTINRDLWRERIRNITIHLENPDDKYNINIDLAPAYAQQVVQSPAGTMEKNMGFGVSVKLDINNRDMTKDLDMESIAGILAFAEDYVPDKLVKFLNNERV